jgi:hypothetical protein
MVMRIGWWLSLGGLGVLLGTACGEEKHEPGGSSEAGAAGAVQGDGGGIAGNPASGSPGQEDGGAAGHASTIAGGAAGESPGGAGGADQAGRAWRHAAGRENVFG